jgi:cation diffusion facilitator CzcD-associated flavoprotein CzcO
LRGIGIDDVVVLEGAPSLGGTWRDNTYPGCACDVPSALYSYSFAPNPEWTRFYAPHDEIRAYLERTAARLGVTPQIRLNTWLDRANWNEAERVWELTTSTGSLRARWVISAC